MLLAHLKPILKLDRLRLRGLSGAQDEFLLAATAQQLQSVTSKSGAPGFERKAVALNALPNVTNQPGADIRL